ncbi:MAG: pilus assembly protein PilP [Azoarcus sp.]|jgi:type IV pilus assembly protein PilP|nr:pilus assembly protein PilP [Azoarcus sp.]
MKTKLVLAVIACSVLASGCANDQEDIQKWMEEQAAGMRGAVKPLPEIKIYPVVDFVELEGSELFNIARIEPAKPEKMHSSDPRLDPDRQREPLEAYPLETLKMVGILQQTKGTKGIHALIQADKSLYQVHIGNFMGRNYGKIVGIQPDSLELQELVEDPSQGWVERITTVQLQEPQEAGK